MTDNASNEEQTENRRPMIGAGWRPAPDASKEIRDSVLRHVEAQRASLEQLRSQIQRSQIDQEGGDALDWIEQRLTFLDGIEASANSAPLPALLSLSFAMPAIATATATVLSAAKAEAAMQIGTAMGEMSTEAYHQYSHAIEARVRKTDAVNGRHFQSALGTLDRHGLGDHFRKTSTDLEAEREAAEKRGQHGNARVADALIAHNTLNALDKALDVEDDPKKHQQLEAERQRQLDVIAEREAAMRKQLMLDGIRDAQERGLSGTEAAEHATRYQQQELDTFRKRRDEMRDKAGINDAAKYQDALKAIDGKRADAEARTEADLAALDTNTLKTAQSVDRINPTDTRASVAHAYTDKSAAAKDLASEAASVVDTANDFAFESETISTKHAAAESTLERATAQFRAQSGAKSEIKADAGKDAEPAAPAPTPAGTKTAEAKSKGASPA